MIKMKLTCAPEHIVYILSDKSNVTFVGISGNIKLLFDEQKNSFSKLIYFEKFSDKDKAFRRKRDLDKIDESKRLRIVKNKNPELLNLIFTIYGN